MITSLSNIFQAAINHSASDIHLSSGTPPLLRILGELHPLADTAPLAPSDIIAYRNDIYPTSTSQTENSQTVRSPTPTTSRSDFRYTDPFTNRSFRVNAFSHSRGPALALRLIPATVPTLAELNTPAIVADLAMRPRGLVIVTGPTGTGKSATLAAMVDHLNRHRRAHILTLEDPIEHEHKGIHCLISQREIHAHARGYAQALKDAMREDPDVILVGEMRDPETIRMALTAAETGHLVLATLHTSSAAKSIDRIIDVFPGDEKEIVRTMLAESLQGIIAQQLARHRNEPRRLGVFEILLCTPAIRNCIKEGKVGQVRGLMTTNRQNGMITLDQALADLVTQGRISREEASNLAHEPNTLF